MVPRLAGNPSLDQDLRDAYRGGVPVRKKKELGAPFGVTKSQRIGVQFMGDIFHERVPDQYIEQVYNVMLQCKLDKLGHKFLVLTKRPKRLTYIAAMYTNIGHFLGVLPGVDLFENIWHGISCENQSMLEWRLPDLIGAHVSHRFISFEPLLGPIDFQGRRPNIDWAIIGSESITGKPGRECRREWVAILLGQLNFFGIPVYVKQLTIEGKLLHDPKEFPPALREREIPKELKK